MRSALVTVLVLTIAALGCSEDAEWSGMISEAAGVTVVQNPATPIEREEVLLRSDLTVEDPDWRDIVDLAATGDEVILLDRPGHRIIRVDGSTGEIIASFGREGAGPGEFERPFGVAVAGDRIYVGDSGSAGIDVFDASGNYIETIRTGGLVFSLHSAEEEGVFFRRGMGGEQQWLRLTPGSTEAMPLSVEPWEQAASQFDGACIRSTAGPSGITEILCSTMIFRHLGPDGRMVRQVSADLPTEPVEENVLDEHLASVRQTMASSGMPSALIRRQVDQQRELLSSNPRFREVQHSGDLYVVWEQKHPDLGLEPAEFHFFDEIGRWLASSSISAPLHDFLVTNDRIYALEIDEVTGLKSLRSYVLPPEIDGGAQR